MAEKNTSVLVTISVAGRKQEAKGKSVIEAIGKLKPGNVHTKVIMTVTHGKESRERVLGAYHAMRLFSTQGITKEILLKNTALLFE